MQTSHDSLPVSSVITQKNLADRILCCLVVAVLASMVGCGSDLKPRPVVEDQQGHIRNLVIQLMQYKGRNAGRPVSESGFKAFLAANKQQADQMLVSPRDRHPYIIRYETGKSTKPGEGGGDIVAYEKMGVQGKRLVVTSMASVQEVDETEFRKLVPDAK